MDLGPLRVLVSDLNFTAHGVPATVTRPNEAPISTRVIWFPFTTDGAGLELQRLEPVRVMVIQRSQVPTVPKSTLISAPEKAGDAAQMWRVDGYEGQQADQHRVIVIPAPEV